MRFRVWGLGFGVRGLGFRLWGLKCGGLGLRLRGFGGVFGGVRVKGDIYKCLGGFGGSGFGPGGWKDLLPGRSPEPPREVRGTGHGGAVPTRAVVQFHRI